MLLRRSPSCAELSFGPNSAHGTSSHSYGSKGWLQFSERIVATSKCRATSTGQEMNLQYSVSVHPGRPTLDDVERLSRGRASKAKIGSRAVPHRLNADERKAFELAKKKGFVIHQPNTRRYPLINSHRNYCDALGIPCIRIDQGSAGQQDEVVMDLTSLRLSEGGLQSFKEVVIEAVASILSPKNQAMNPSSGEEVDPTSDADDRLAPSTVQSEVGSSASLYVHFQTIMSIVEPSEESKPLKFQASSRNEAKLVAQTAIETWRTWSISNLKVLV